MVDVFKENGAKVVARLEAKAAAGAPLDIQSIYYQFTMDSIGTIGFGADLECLATEEQTGFARAFDSAQAHMLERLLNPLWIITAGLTQSAAKYAMPGEAAFRRSVAEVRRFGLRMVRERRAELAAGTAPPSRNDLLTNFLKLAAAEPGGGGGGDGDGQQQHAFSDAYLVDVVLNFMIAGRDTTAATLTWATYHLARDAAAAAKVVAEVDAVLRGGEPTHKAVTTRLPYTKAFLSETLRLHPPVPKDLKQAVKRDTLPDGTVVPSGGLVLFVPYTMGRDPTIWGDDALEFTPERWLPPRMAKKDQPDAYTFPVFQGGARTCLGKNMAYFEAATLLALLLQRFTFHLLPGEPEPVAAESVTMPVSGGLRVRVQARVPPVFEEEEEGGAGGIVPAAAAAVLGGAGDGAHGASKCPFHQAADEGVSKL